ncbi:MAG: DUF3139 domain-containing protein [Solibacillus sp.]
MKSIYKVAIGLIALMFAVMLAIIYALNNNEPHYDPELISYTEEKVKEYLLQEKGYSENEIQKVKSTKKLKSSDDSASAYDVMVTFSDEPNAIYYYQVDSDKVSQFGISGPAVKHREN